MLQTSQTRREQPGQGTGQAVAEAEATAEADQQGAAGEWLALFGAVG
jgi:hypothetical protein